MVLARSHIQVRMWKISRISRRTVSPLREIPTNNVSHQSIKWSAQK